MKLTLYCAHTGAMYIRIAHSGRRSLVPLGVHIDADKWQRGKVSPLMKAALEEQLTAAKVEVLRQLGGTLPDLPAIRAVVAEAITRQPQQLDGGNLLAFFASCIERKPAASTRQIYTSTLHRLQQWRNDAHRINFDDLTRANLDDFRRWLASHGCPGINAQAIHLRNIRAVYNDAIAAGLTTAYPFRGYHIPTAETVSRALSLADVRAVCAEGSEWAMLWALIFHLAGINLADLFRLTPADIAGGRLRYRRQKTGKQIDIPLTDEAVDLLERMKGERLLVAICERYANVHSFTISANRGFGRLRPGLTSYWARHSWASIAVNVCGIAVEVVGRALGHSVGQRVTLIYARLDTAQVDAAVVAVSRAVGG